MRTRNQDYAERTYNLVIALKTTADHSKLDRYGGMAHSLPALIRSAGLCQALAFVQTRDDDGCNALLEHLAKAVRGDKSNTKELLSAARTTELLEYTRLTREVLQALTWFKRYAQSVLDTDSTSGAP
jgi:CRISPR-associated protein Cmr5